MLTYDRTAAMSEEMPQHATCGIADCTYNDIRAPRSSKSPAGSESNPFDPRRLET